MELIVAFSTNDGENLLTDDHAGMARYFDVYRFTEETVAFVERRGNSKYAGDAGLRHGDPEKAKQSLSALDGVQAWVSPRFGPNLPRLLKKVVCVVVRTQTIASGTELLSGNLDAVAAQWANGEERQHLVLKPE